MSYLLKQSIVTECKSISAGNQPVSPHFSRRLCIWLAALLLALLPALPVGATPTAHAASTALPASHGQPIPIDQLGLAADKQAAAGHSSIVATGDGASIRADFQDLAGRLTSDGLWLHSTDDATLRATPFRVMAQGVGRETGPAQLLPATGTVAVAEGRAQWRRPGVIEEYRATSDGVRQDFLLVHAPTGRGQVRLDLAVDGATVANGADGLRLTLADGRELVYGQLHVTDAAGRILSAQMYARTSAHITIAVDDRNATWPLRIDPTFSDADWVSMGAFLTVGGTVNTVATIGSDLYVGGQFSSVGVAGTGYLAKWNGSAWSALGTGLNGQARVLATIGSDLYVGGDFTSAGGVAGTGYLAKWNSGVWSAVGTGVNGPVNTLATSGSDLYVGGSFTSASGVAGTGYLAKWNGSGWSALGTGVNSTVNALLTSGSDLYVGGNFTSADGVVGTNRIAKWNGSGWSALGTGVNAPVYALVMSGSDLYVGGNFTAIDGAPGISRIAKWNGSAWLALGTGVNGQVWALATSGSDLYVGGFFTSAGGVPGTSYLAKWNGSTWSALGTGVNNVVYSLAVNGSDLYVGGWFTSAGGVAGTNNIAKWNGSTWSALGTGVNSTVLTLATSGSDLYVGGQFTSANGVAGTSYLAKWNGSAWSALGGGLNGQVWDLAISGSDLYVGGNFTSAGGVAGANYLAKWNGSAWSALGAGVNGQVFTLAMNGSDLYAGGQFTSASGAVGTGYLAKWNGTLWSGLGAGVNGHVWALALKESDLYVGGQFSSAGGLAGTNNIAKWNGSGWSALGTGVNSTVLALATSGSDLYVGGQFSSAGGKLSTYLAKAQLPPPAPEIVVMGNSTPIASGDSTPSLTDHTDFGRVRTTGGTVVRTFTVQNSGDLTLSGVAATVSGNAAFSLSSTPTATVSAGGSTTFQVAFAPIVTGTMTATVSIASNDSDENPYTFVIRGARIDSANAGLLTGSLSDNTKVTNFNLTTEGTTDWALWGTGSNSSLTPVVRKNGGTAISALTDLSPSYPLRALGQFGAVGHTFQWQNGAPTASASNVPAGLQHNNSVVASGITEGFSFTAPADTTTRRLRIYGSHHKATGQVTARLSDDSAADFVALASVNGENTSAVIEIVYRAASAGQTLTVEWIIPTEPEAYSNVGLFAVTLATLAPEINVQGNGATIASGDTTPASSDHTDFGSVVTNGGTVVRTFTIQNSGDATLSGIAATVSGNAAFSLSSTPPVTVSAGSNSTFQVTFAPSAAGVVTATVRVANNDSDENPYLFTIQGSGIPQYSVTTATNGTGSGSISLDPAGGLYNAGTVVTATATADSGSTFSGWSGDCSGVGACVLTMNAAKAITATFTLPVACPLVVTSSNDSGAGTLRQAIADAGPSCNQIVFASGLSNQTIRLATQLIIAKDLTIDGSGRKVTISGDTNNDGAGDVPVFTINSGVVTLSHLTIADGFGSDGLGGGVSIGNAQVLIRHSTLRNNVSDNGDAFSAGGGIYNTGVLTLTNSTVSGNQAANLVGLGGGIHTGSGSVTTIQYSTITGNSSPDNGAGGGINVEGGHLTLLASIVSGNSAAAGPEIAVGSGGVLVVDGYNVLGANGSAGLDGATPGTTDRVPTGALATVINPTLADNGGDSLTHALVINGPAYNDIPVNTGGCGTTVTVDQRGAPRPAGAGCDVGAVESTPPANNPPTAQADSATVNEDSVNNSITVLGNDSTAPDSGESLTIISVGTPDAGGAVSSDGALLTYTPASNFSGSEVFTYTVSDGNGGQATATVTVVVTPVNDAPQTRILSKPLNPSAATVTFGFDGSDLDGTVTAFECKLDSAAFAPCSSPQAYSGLSVGSHTFGVRAVDNSGAVDPTPARYTWAVTAGTASITIELAMTPEITSNVRFTGTLGTFFLDDGAVDDGDAYSNTQVFTVGAGSYTVNQRLTAGWYLAAITCTPSTAAAPDLTNNRVTITVGDGDAVTCRFEVQRTVNLYARAYHDLVRNGANRGKRNSGDPYLAGIGMTLYLSPTNTVAGAATTIGATGAITQAHFMDLPAGAYVVCATLPSGWTQTDPNPASSLPG